MARHKNASWDLPAATVSDPISWEHVRVGLLMDIRDELLTLNALLRCPNFVGIPKTLQNIEEQLKLQRRCPRHPRYTGRLKPRVSCVGCHRLYRSVRT